MSSITYCNISNQYNVTKRPVCYTPGTSERHIPNDEYKNFVTAYIEIPAERIPTEPRAKWKGTGEAISVREKREYPKKYPYLIKEI